MEMGSIRVGIGLPTSLPGRDGRLVVAWAKEAEERGFTTLAVIDRIAYDCDDPFVALAAAAAVTGRIQLLTSIVIAPLRNTVLLAKAAASLDALSGGRLLLGLGVGAREDDYTTAAIDYRSRGDRLSEQLADLATLWENETIGRAVRRPRLLVGGTTDRTFARMARYCDGYVFGGGGPRALVAAVEKARAAWIDAARPGRPQICAMAYFALGDETAARGTRYLRDYYAFTGPFAERIAAGLLKTPQQVRQLVRAYQDAGCDEVILFPTVADIGEVARLADVVFPRA
jgi:alkanesulfonate monooxygenase SsuD/methylene tetrahydromethanopterin reductase-like flavin-dependent oxidoreductase (luciferase family)